MNGTLCIVQSVPSQYADCIYLSVVPASLFWCKLNDMQRFNMIAFSLFTILSCLLAVMLSRQNYAPISNLMNEMTLLSPADGRIDSQWDEIDYIRSVIQNTTSREIELRSILRSDLLRKVLHGRLSRDLNSQAYLSQAGISLLSDRFTVLLIQFEDRQTEDVSIEITDAAMNQIIMDMCPDSMQAFLLSEQESYYVCILNSAQPTEPVAYALCEKIAVFFGRSIHSTLTFACGDEGEGLRGIRHSYEQALEAISYRAVYGPSSIIRFSQLQKQPFQYTFSARDNIEQLVLSCLRKGKPSPADLVTEIQQLCCRGEIRHPNEFKCFYFDMRDILRQSAVKLNIPLSHFDALECCDSLPTFREALIDILETLPETEAESSSSDSSRNSRLCNQIRSFIDENFADPSLSVSSVGAHFDMSGQYLSRLFQNDSGISIAAYISGIRIRHAKILLKDPSLSINEVSRQCGFLSASTFIRLFSKLEGVTPGIYQHSCEENSPQ